MPNVTDYLFEIGDTVRRVNANDHGYGYGHDGMEFVIDTRSRNDIGNFYAGTGDAWAGTYEKHLVLVKNNKGTPELVASPYRRRDDATAPRT